MDKEIMCVECEEFYPVDNMAQLSNGDFICEDCERENYYFCDECDELRRWDEVKIYKNLGVVICEHCGTEPPR